MLEIEGLQRSYGDVRALAGVDLAVRPGEILGLLGPNGAGKTTLVSIVAGLRRADSGQVRVDGIDALRRPTEVRRRLGLAPQDLGIYPVLTVRENLVFFGELAGLRRQTLHERIDEIAAALDLAAMLSRQARFLSGGEKRRLHTAMALLHRPPLLLLDEATTGVDVATRARVLDVVRSLAHKGAAICYSTHYLAEVEGLGASVAIIDRGQIIARGSVDEVVERHAESVLELTFEGDAPGLGRFAGVRVERRGSVLRVFAERPAAQAARVLAALGDAAGALRSIDVVRPSLESVFLALTGRRFSPEADGGDENGDAAALGRVTEEVRDVVAP